MINTQKTIQKSAHISGQGLHTGHQINLTFKPADVNSGILFKRTDIQGFNPVKLTASDVYDTSRGTSLCKNGADFKTVEHLLAALSGMGIDNIIVEMDTDETPILDGSSQKYVDLLNTAGIVDQKIEKTYLNITEEIRYVDDEKGIELIALPNDDFQISVMVDYNSQIIAAQHAELNHITDFISEIAPCRTFVFLHELQYLIAHNLVKGGDVDNAVVFVESMPDENTLKQLAAFFNRSNIKVSEHSVLNNTNLRFENEPARHKLLDLLGDLSLVGMPLKAKIIAKKPGHSSNIKFAKMIQDYYLKQNHIL